MTVLFVANGSMVIKKVRVVVAIVIAKHVAAIKVLRWKRDLNPAGYKNKVIKNSRGAYTNADSQIAFENAFE